MSELSEIFQNSNRSCEIIYVEEKAPEPWIQRETFYDKNLPYPEDDDEKLSNAKHIGSFMVPSPLMRLKTPSSMSSYISEREEDGRISPVPSLDKSIKSERKYSDTVLYKDIGLSSTESLSQISGLTGDLNSSMKEYENFGVRKGDSEIKISPLSLCKEELCKSEIHGGQDYLEPNKVVNADVKLGLANITQQEILTNQYGPSHLVKRTSELTKVLSLKTVEQEIEREKIKDINIEEDDLRNCGTCLKINQSELSSGTQTARNVVEDSLSKSNVDTGLFVATQSSVAFESFSESSTENDEQEKMEKSAEIEFKDLPRKILIPSQDNLFDDIDVSIVGEENLLSQNSHVDKKFEKEVNLQNKVKYPSEVTKPQMLPFNNAVLGSKITTPHPDLIKNISKTIDEIKTEKNNMSVTELEKGASSNEASQDSIKISSTLVPASHESDIDPEPLNLIIEENVSHKSAFTSNEENYKANLKLSTDSNYLPLNTSNETNDIVSLFEKYGSISDSRDKTKAEKVDENKDVNLASIKSALGLAFAAETASSDVRPSVGVVTEYGMKAVQTEILESNDFKIENIEANLMTKAANTTLESSNNKNAEDDNFNDNLAATNYLKTGDSSIINETQSQPGHHDIRMSPANGEITSYQSQNEFEKDNDNLSADGEERAENIHFSDNEEIYKVQLQLVDTKFEADKIHPKDAQKLNYQSSSIQLEDKSGEQPYDDMKMKFDVLDDKMTLKDDNGLSKDGFVTEAIHSTLSNNPNFGGTFFNDTSSGEVKETIIEDKNVPKNVLLISPNDKELETMIFMYDSLINSELIEAAEHLANNEIKSEFYAKTWFESIFSGPEFSSSLSEKASKIFKDNGPAGLVEIAVGLMEANSLELLALDSKEEILKKLSSDMNSEEEALTKVSQLKISPKLLFSLLQNYASDFELTDENLVDSRLTLLVAKCKNAQGLLEQLSNLIKEMNYDICELTLENNKKSLRIKALEDILQEKEK